ALLLPGVDQLFAAPHFARERLVPRDDAAHFRLDRGILTPVDDPAFEPRTRREVREMAPDTAEPESDLVTGEQS
ncbi:hypothetical protein ABI019_15180, partial [Enterococcus faecium]|uniref:hypothetical protein n=1 Tax=Enterococcus faecium TaxID=1352 RepID=UPI003F43276E